MQLYHDRYNLRMTVSRTPGPLSTRPGGLTNYAIEGPKHRLLFEPHPRRYRAVIDGHTVLSTTRGHLLHESELLPVLYAPLEDFDASLLEATDHTTHCPFKGDASYWSVRTPGRTVENAVWAYEAPIEAASWLDGYAALYWTKADAWFEEDEEVLGHIRDPYHRVDVRRSSRHVVVTAHGEVIAESDRPALLFETGLPVRVYLPLEDVTAGLEPSDKQTVCPYKGVASYRSLRSSAGTLADVAWSYEDPLAGARGIAGLVSFLGDGVEVKLEDAGILAGAAA